MSCAELTIDSPEQLLVLHVVEDVADPEHSFPLQSGAFWVLVRVLLPPSQVLEHDPHSLHVFHVQSTKKG